MYKCDLLASCSECPGAKPATKNNGYDALFLHLNRRPDCLPGQSVFSDHAISAAKKKDLDIKKDLINQATTLVEFFKLAITFWTARSVASMPPPTSFGAGT